MRPILILIGMILGLYILNKKIPNQYILIITFLSSGVAALSVILVAVIMLHFSGN